MSIQQIRKSVLIAAGIVVLGIAGLVAGRLSAGAFPGHGKGDPAFRMFHHMAEALDLTDDQKAKIKEVLKAHAAEIEAQMRASATARRALHQATLADSTDESAIRAAAQSLGAVQGDSALLIAKVRKEVDPILTDDQKTKLRQLRENARSRSDSTIKSFESFLGNRS
ncbi:MAG TPA: Spy/CpxP family protein refolding chaperone [Thermoanaerobaculia bacterium]|nr:Spy/CpxP family protein refolding chaperone [Thermoanaerobaculia bacterium]